LHGYLTNAARVKYPAALQRSKLDTPLLAAGFLIRKRRAARRTAAQGGIKGRSRSGRLYGSAGRAGRFFIFLKKRKTSSNTYQNMKGKPGRRCSKR